MFLFQFACPNCRRNFRIIWSFRFTVTVFKNWQLQHQSQFQRIFFLMDSLNSTSEKKRNCNKWVENKLLTNFHQVPMKWHTWEKWNANSILIGIKKLFCSDILSTNLKKKRHLLCYAKTSIFLSWIFFKIISHSGLIKFECPTLVKQMHFVSFNISNS